MNIRAGFVALLLASPFAFASEPAIHSSILLQASQSWDGRAYGSYPEGIPQLTVRKVTLQPGAQFPWHRHPVPAAGYVISGSLEVESRDGEHKAVLGPGEVFAEMQGVVHRARGGRSVTELLFFYAGAQGIPVAVDTPD